MKIIVFGASGPTGKLVVSRGLDHGHQITAVTRKPEEFPLHHRNLNVVRGDAMDPSSLSAVLAGHDAVLSAMGVGRNFKATTLYSEGGRNIVEAMRKKGVTRLITLTSGGVEEEDPAFGLFYKVVFRPLLKKVYQDCQRWESYLQAASDIQWTVVRPTALTGKPFSGRYRVSPRFSPPRGTQISRADLADFMLKQIGSDEWVHRTPTLAY